VKQEPAADRQVSDDKRMREIDLGALRGRIDRRTKNATPNENGTYNYKFTVHGPSFFLPVYLDIRSIARSLSISVYADLAMLL
jgi:hypothetical protein